jgi:hypothetical protein
MRAMQNGRRGKHRSRVPGAAQRETLRCKTGTQQAMNPGLAVQHFVLHRIRDKMPDYSIGATIFGCFSVEASSFFGSIFASV